jgi:formamidopyrimidine-DNA glycosylase
MPEGPEVWILSKAINALYSNDNTSSYGKHLIIKDLKENWSFGLNGKVGISHFNELVKINTGWINGDKIKYGKYYEDSIKDLGINWMTASKEELEKEVDKWIKSKKKLAALILDQTKISGIGVAWGSEILFKADLRPDIKACDQTFTEGSSGLTEGSSGLTEGSSALNKLVDSMIEVRKKIQETYELELTRTLEVCKIYNDDNKLRLLINEWFENLYEIREMNIYKKGSKLQVLGRSWWV